ncbi:MAG: phosphotransferase [Eubacterium sp.]|nr:phosphotransferase [Eubacterium sp.]
MNLELINTRRNNKIYLDENNTYKIFNKGYDKRLVFLESFITTEVEAAGVNVPSILEITNKNDQWTFKSERIDGMTLYEILKDNPENADTYLDKMVEVHTSIHQHKCPKLPIQKQKLADYIQAADLDSGLKIDLLDMLNSSPKHNKLVHGNFTPHNIIISRNGDYIVDWNHAAQGSASADIAYTYIWMQMNMPEYAETYLKKFCDATNTSSRYVHNWIPIVAAARLGKKVSGEEELLNSLISVIEY